MDGSLVCFLGAILIVGIFIFVAIILTQKRGHNFDVTAYQTRFLNIENSLKKDSPATYNMAIVEADKLLDKALCELGIAGKTMGERLKKSSSRFSKINSVWHAHKLRNQIAHESGFQVEYMQATHALTIYKQALKDLGAI